MHYSFSLELATRKARKNDLKLNGIHRRVVDADSTNLYLLRASCSRIRRTENEVRTPVGASECRIKSY